jgi:hypothetical protein
VVKAVLKSAFCLFALSGLLYADQIAISQFKGLNNNENSLIIDPSEAQDLLNIDVTPGGKSFKKRSGYGVFKALGTGQAIHGGYHFFDSTGNDVQVWGSSTSLYGIVASASPTQLVSSATLNSTWDCADTQGNAYCVNSNRNALIRTNGATMTWFSSVLGTMIEGTPDRMAVAGVSGTPNTLFVSGSNDFTNYTVGLNATDPFTEVIASPGSKLTHIRWGCGRLLWWKDQSFGYVDFDDQFNLQNKIVSDTIGSFDNTSAIDPGGSVWFRGQDGHTWRYDCSSLEKMSIDITPNVQVSGKRVSNSWSQTSQSDFQAGASSPTPNISFTISPGDVIVSSFQAVENSSTQWNSGSASSVTVNASSITLATNSSGNVTNNDFENGTINVADVTGWTEGSDNGFIERTQVTSPCTLNPQSGSRFVEVRINSAGWAAVAQLTDVDGNVLYTLALPTTDNACAWTQDTISSSGLLRKRVKLKFSVSDNIFTNTSITVSDSFILGGDITFYRSLNKVGTPGTWSQSFDNVQNGSSTITSGSFTSQVYNTGFTSSTFQLQTSYTANTSTPSFSLQTSSTSTGPWATLVTSTGTNAVGNQYVRWISTISITASDSALTSITNATILSRSTGTFYSAVHNSPNLTAWSTLGVNSVNNDGTQTFYVRASTNSFITLSSTPTWVSQTAGALITASTGTYIQFRDDFALTAATQTPTLNDFTLNWFEGSAADQAYMIYFDNAIWQSVAFGSGQATNNYIFKYDLINQGWTLYNFGAGGILVQSNSLYFGDTSTSGGNVFNYGTTTSDNGTAINAFWRSKTFTGNDPFLQNQLTQIDVFAKKDQGTTLTSTYTLDTTTATAYSISLSSANAFVQSRKLIPAGKLGYGFDLKLGDTSASSAWEGLGWRIGFNQLPYRPAN